MDGYGRIESGRDPVALLDSRERAGCCRGPPYRGRSDLRRPLAQVGGRLRRTGSDQSGSTGRPAGAGPGSTRPGRGAVLSPDLLGPSGRLPGVAGRGTHWVGRPDRPGRAVLLGPRTPGAGGRRRRPDRPGRTPGDRHRAAAVAGGVRRGPSVVRAAGRRAAGGAGPAHRAREVAGPGRTRRPPAGGDRRPAMAGPARTAHRSRPTRQRRPTHAAAVGPVLGVVPPLAVPGRAADPLPGGVHRPVRAALPPPAAGRAGAGRRGSPSGPDRLSAGQSRDGHSGRRAPRICRTCWRSRSPPGCWARWSTR